MTKVMKGFNARLGIDYWAVTWGKGITETAICLSEAEAVALATRGERRKVEPLISFRAW